MIDIELQRWGSFTNHVDIILPFFDHPPTSVDIFYVLNVDKNDQFYDMEMIDNDIDISYSDLEWINIL